MIRPGWNYWAVMIPGGETFELNRGPKQGRLSFVYCGLKATAGIIGLCGKWLHRGTPVSALGPTFNQWLRETHTRNVIENDTLADTIRMEEAPGVFKIRKRAYPSSKQVKAWNEYTQDHHE